MNPGTRRFRPWSISIAVAVAALAAGPALADLTCTFTAITDYKAANVAIGESQFSLEVSSYGNNQALFTFSNTGSAASEITAVYFDDGSLLGIAQLIDRDEGSGTNVGVDFTQGASPANLQDGGSIGFVATAGFSADADTPASRNWGVNPGEYLVIVFNLQEGNVFADVLGELATGALRVGIYAEKFPDGGHESFVAVPVPLPAAAILGILGLGVAGLRLRKFV